MEIINNKLNSLPEQVEENMLNIQKLAQYLKEAYKTSSQLTTSTSSIAISDTNAPTSVVDGWLLDSRGLLFKINGGDTINFLLEFYTDLKGVQGNNGADGINGADGNSFIVTTGTLAIGYTATIQDTDFNVTPKLNDLVLDGNSIVGLVTAISGNDVSVYGLYSIKGEQGTTAIDDNSTSLLTTWSSKKISDKMDLISDKGIYYTLVQPTLNGSYYELNTSDLANPNQYTYQKYNDIIVYIDSDEKVKEIYNCIGVSGDFSLLTLQKVGDVGGGAQFYKHTAQTINSAGVNFYVEWIDDNPNAETINDFIQYLIAKGFTIAVATNDSDLTKLYHATGYSASLSASIRGVMYNTGTSKLAWYAWRKTAAYEYPYDFSLSDFIPDHPILID